MATEDKIQGGGSNSIPIGSSSHLGSNTGGSSNNKRCASNVSRHSASHARAVYACKMMHVSLPTLFGRAANGNSGGRKTHRDIT